MQAWSWWRRRWRCGREWLCGLADSDDGFYHSGTGTQPGRHEVGEVRHVATVGDPGGGVDDAGFDQLDDLGEVGREGVAGGEEGELAPMKKGVVQGHGLLGDADKKNPTGEAGER